jgi:hypothetical protein
MYSQKSIGATLPFNWSRLSGDELIQRSVLKSGASVRSDCGDGWQKAADANKISAAAVKHAAFLPSSILNKIRLSIHGAAMPS